MVNNHLDRQRILSIFFFLAMMAINWFYIFSIGQQSPIITRLVVVIPFLITLCVGLGLIGLFALFYYNFWGFAVIYFMIVSSGIFAIVVDQSLHNAVIEPFPLSALLVIDCVVLLYIAYFQRNATKTS